MIKCKEGKVRLKGSVADLLVDYTCITRTLKEMLIEDGIPTDGAAKMLEESHRIGTLTNEELNKEIGEKLWQVLEKAQEELRKEMVEEDAE